MIKLVINTNQSINILSFYICRSFPEKYKILQLKMMIMVFNATFNNISVITWQSVLLVEETGVPGENHRHVTSH